jgi:formate dehydrogenase major subunit
MAKSSISSFRKVRDLVKDSKEPRDEIIRKAFWTYTTAEDVLKEINGYAVRDNPETGLKKGDLIRKVSDLKADGSTRPAPGSTPASSPAAKICRSAATSVTDPGDLGLYPGFGGPGRTTCASSITARRATRTASLIRARKPIVWWDEKAKRWTGLGRAGCPRRDRRDPTRRTASGPSIRAPRRRPSVRGCLQGP